MPRKIISLFAVLPFVMLLAPAAYAAAPMYIPGPIEVPAGKSVEEVKRSVRKALFDEEFQAREIGPGEVQGKRTSSGKNGAYSATVNVTYDSRTVRIVYKDSEKLSYDSKNQTIHGTYNRWARNIEKRVRRELGAY